MDQDKIEPQNSRQYIYKEVLYDPREMDYVNYDIDFSEESSIIAEACNIARQLLWKRVLEIADKCMTDHQKRVFVLRIKDKTYHDIAAVLFENYSCTYSGYTAISHAIRGQYNKQHEKYHGGFEKKLQKHCVKDSRCLKILKQISDMNDDVERSYQFINLYEQKGEKVFDE